MLHGCDGNEKLILKSPLLPFHLPMVLSFILFLWVYSSFFLHRFYVDLFSGSSNLRGMSYELSSADVDSSSKLVSLAGTSLQSRNSLGQVLSWIQTAGRQRASFKWLCQLDQWAKTMTTKTSVQIVRHQVFQELYGVLVDLNCFFVCSVENLSPYSDSIDVCQQAYVWTMKYSLRWCFLGSCWEVLWLHMFS